MNSERCPNGLTGCPVTCCPIPIRRPTTQARSQATTNERSDVLALVAELLAENDRLKEQIERASERENLLLDRVRELVRGIEAIKAICIQERAR